MRGVVCAVATMLIGMATAAGQEPASQMTGCLRDGQLRNFELGDEPKRECRRRREVEVKVPINVGDTVPINLEMIAAPHDQDFNIRDLVIDERDGLAIRFACRMERDPSTTSSISIATGEQEVLLHSVEWVERESDENGESGANVEELDGPEVVPPQSIRAIRNISLRSEFEYGFLVADLTPLEESSIHVHLRVFATVEFPPDGRCFFHGTMHVMPLGPLELDDFPD